MKRSSLLSCLLCSLPLLAQTTAGTPLTLEQAVAEAISNNLDLAAERYNVSVARARETTAGLRPNPVATLSGMTLNTFGTTFSSDRPLGPNQFNAHTDFIMERNGKRAKRVEVAQADRGLAEFGVREVMRQVAYNVQSSFVTVQQSKANLMLAQDNLQSLRGIVDINEARVRSGDLAPVELERSRIAALTYETGVQRAQLALDQAKSQLQLLLGRRAHDANFDVSGDIRRETLTQTPETIRTLALQQRPDVLGTQSTQARNQSDLRLQLANGKADLTLGAEYTYQRAYGIGGSTLGFSVAMPLMIFNKNQGEIARAQQQIRQSQSRLEALQATLDTEVDLAYRQYDSSQRLLTNIETNMLARARSVRDTTEYSYRRGEATLVEFLDAQRAFNETTQAYNDARADVARSLYLIDSVTASSIK